MEIKSAEASWFLQESNQVESPIVTTPATPEIQNEPATNATTPKVEETVVVPEVNLPDSLSGIFDQITSNKDYNLAWYEDRKINTPDDVVELININAEYKFDEAVKNLDKTWYESKSPVFQQFAQMAELAGDDVSKLYSLIETQRVVDDYNSLDTSDITQAEVVVENYMRLRDEPREVIAEEIADLKERGKLTERADKYKPILINHFENEKVQKIAQEQQSLQTFYRAIDDNEQSVLKFLSNKEIAGMRLKNEDKDLIYNNLAYNPEIQGFSIYQKIESLQKEGKYEQLAKAILLLENEERFDEIYSTRIKGQVAKDLKGKLRFASETSETQSDAVQKTSVKDQVPITKEGKVYNPFTGTYT